MSESHTQIELRDGIAEITLNRPERMNAWTAQMAAELNEAFQKFHDDDSVRAIIVTGAGRAFCAGADLGRGSGTFAGREPSEAPANRARPIHPWEVNKPIIAAINGHAVGVGITFPLQFDLRIVAKTAKLQFAFVQRGVVTELSSSYILPRMVGMARAADLLMTGRQFSGEEAAALGVANEALDAEAVLPRAREIAAYIRDHAAPASVALTKRLMWEHLNTDNPTLAAVREAKGLAKLGQLEDAREGVASFLEKRPPVWRSSASDAPDV